MEALQIAFYIIGIVSMVWIGVMTTIIAGFKVYAYIKAREAMNSQLSVIPLEQLLGGGGAPGMGAPKRGANGGSYGGVPATPGVTHGRYM